MCRWEEMEGDAGREDRGREGVEEDRREEWREGS